jgi:hypothetical protein
MKTTRPHHSAKSTMLRPYHSPSWRLLHAHKESEAEHETQHDKKAAGRTHHWLSQFGSGAWSSRSLRSVDRGHIDDPVPATIHHAVIRQALLDIAPAGFSPSWSAHHHPRNAGCPSPAPGLAGPAGLADFAAAQVIPCGARIKVARHVGARVWAMADAPIIEA